MRFLGLVLSLCLGVAGAYDLRADTAPQPVLAGSMTPVVPRDVAGLLQSPRPTPRAAWAQPSMAWDDVPEAAAWTRATLAALRGPARPLLDVVPDDIANWCPAYPNADPAQRAAFWAGLVSSLAYYESTHRADAVGGGGRWFGLVQISPATARHYACTSTTGAELLDGPSNLRCGLRIMGQTVPRDGVVSEGMRGVAADWGPFHARIKREGMRDWVMRQSYCIPAQRPVLRPARVRHEPVRPSERPWDQRTL